MFPSHSSVRVFHPTPQHKRIFPHFFALKLSISPSALKDRSLFCDFFCTCAGKVILNDIFVLILCFISYRVLFVGRPFQELPQNVFVSRFTQYWLWVEHLKSFVQKCRLSFNCGVYRITLTSGRVWEGLGHITQTINSQFDFFLLVIFTPHPYWTQIHPARYAIVLKKRMADISYTLFFSPFGSIYPLGP